MSRAFLVVLDSVGCGGAPDAARYDDAGADTLGHIAQACARGEADRAGLREGPLNLPTLAALGLGLACKTATGAVPPGLDCAAPRAAYGTAVEVSQGKDTQSGHWEIAGSPADFAFGYFPRTTPALPDALTRALIDGARLPGLLGLAHDSGLAVIEKHGEESRLDGKPIAYTSVDSVLQIAAHEETFGLERLYALCELARRLCDPMRIGRVIARPFVGEAATGFRRTPRRKDYSIPPPDGNVLARAQEAGRAVVSIGKIGDIFAHRDTGQERKGASNDDHMTMLAEAVAALPDGGLCFVNLVDFDQEFGHRRDVAGYAACLERFDRRLAALAPALREGDVMILTADHGNDPTFEGTDHTREQVPILALGVPPRALGRRATFADIGASLAAHLGLPATTSGESFL
jgi:phosphopentomutase